MLKVLDQNEILLAYLENAKDVCVQEKLNSEYLLSFWMPRNDPKFEHIETERYIDCEGQLFIIRTVEEERDSSGKLGASIECEHVFTELLDEYQDLLLSFAGTTAEFALTQYLQGTRFTIGTVSDFGLNDLFDYGETNKLDCIQQVKDVWGGEFKFDKRQVNLLAQRGQNNGVRFEYAKNLKSIKRTTDSKNVVTRLFGYGKDGLTIEGFDTTALTAEEQETLLVGVIKDANGIITSKYINSPYISYYPRPKMGKYDESSIEDQRELLKKMQEHLRANEIPYVTYEVDVIELKKLVAQHSAYAHEAFELGDTVAPYDQPLAVNITARIFEYDRYPYEPKRSKVVIANYRQNLIDVLGDFNTTKTIVEASKSAWDRARSFETDGTLSTQWLIGAIAAATNAINSGTNNCVVTDANGITIYDPTDALKLKRIRLNSNAIGLSDDGGVTYRAAMTSGGMNADLLTVGKILTSLVRIEGDSNFYWDDVGLYAVDPSNPNKLIRFNKEGLKFTTNGGETWSNALDYDGLHVGAQRGTTYGLYDCMALFHYDNTLKSTQGLAPVGTPVATLRPGEGKYGGAVAAEEGTTNLCSYPLDLANEAWGKTNVTIQSDAGTALDGTNTLSKIVETATIGVHEIRTPTMSTSAGNYYTISAVLKQGERRYTHMGLTANQFGTSVYVVVDLQNGIITKVNGSPTEYGIKHLGLGCYLVWVTCQATITGSGTQYIGVDLYDVGGTYTGDGTSGIYIWHPQIEAKPYSTSFVDGTRQTGSLKYPKSVMNATEGTIFFWTKINKFNQYYNAILTTGIDNSVGGRLLIMREFADNSLKIWDGDGINEVGYGSGANTLVEGEWFSGALTWGPDGRALYLNGELVATNTKTTPIGFNYSDGSIQIGTWADGSFLNGLLDEVRLDSVQRTAEEIKAWHESGVPFADPGQTQLADMVETTLEGLVIHHSDGSYSKYGWKGSERYVAGIGRKFLDLSISGIGATITKTIEDPGDGGIPDPVTIQLPDYYKGTDFKVVAVPRSWSAVQGNLDTIVCDVPLENINITNATFVVNAYARYMTAVNGVYEAGISFMYTAFA